MSGYQRQRIAELTWYLGETQRERDEAETRLSALTERARAVCLALGDHPHGLFLWAILGTAMQTALTHVADAIEMPG